MTDPNNPRCMVPSTHRIDTLADAATVIIEDSKWNSLSHRLWHGVQRMLQKPDWPFGRQVNHFSGITDLRSTDQFSSKQGRFVCRVVFDTDGPAAYLKCYRSASIWQRLLATLRPNWACLPGIGEWQHMAWARKHGINVPVALAAGEKIGPCFSRESFLLVEELSGMIPLHQAIELMCNRKPSRAFRRWKWSLIEELVRISRALHDSDHYHKDFYLSHFYMPMEDLSRDRIFQGRIYLIDWHRLGRHRLTGWKWRAKDLAQLLYSSDLPGISDLDRIRFLRCYLGTRRQTTFGHVLQAVVRLKAWRYKQYNARILLSKCWRR